MPDMPDSRGACTWSFAVATFVLSTSRLESSHVGSFLCGVEVAVKW